MKITDIDTALCADEWLAFHCFGQGPVEYTQLAVNCDRVQLFPGISVAILDLNCFPNLGAFIRLAIRNTKAWKNVTLTDESIELSGFAYDTVTPCFSAAMRLASRGMTASMHSPIQLFRAPALHDSTKPPRS
jgi:hypothetical protein